MSLAPYKYRPHDNQKRESTKNRPLRKVLNQVPQDLQNLLLANGLFAYYYSTESYPKLMHFSQISAAKNYTLLDEDFDSNCDIWKSCITGYVAGKFPGFKALNNIIVNTWQCDASLTIHESEWLIYRLSNVDDKLVVLASGPYLAYGKPLILKPMP